MQHAQYTRARARAQAHACACVHVHVHVCVCMCACVQVHVHVCMCMCMCACASACVHVQHVCMCSMCACACAACACIYAYPRGALGPRVVGRVLGGGSGGDRSLAVPRLPRRALGELGSPRHLSCSGGGDLGGDLVARGEVVRFSGFGRLPDFGGGAAQARRTVLAWRHGWRVVVRGGSGVVVVTVGSG
jgi:hypothetical protein